MGEQVETDRVKVRVETLNKTYEGEVEKTKYIDVYCWFIEKLKDYEDVAKGVLWIEPKEGEDILIRVSTVVSLQQIEEYS